MNKKKISIGFDRYIERAWLEQISNWVAQEKSRDELHQLVDEYLAPFINGATSLRKTKNVLFGVWVNMSDKNVQFKKQAVQFLQNCSSNERLAIHWGLSVASYPFFATMVRLVGRLMKLQGDIASKELIRRSVELHGDTESVRRATARLLQSLGQWGVLIPKSDGLFHMAPKIHLTSSELVTTCLSANLCHKADGRSSLRELVSDPAWFPFDIDNRLFNPDLSSIFEIVHETFDDQIVELKSMQFQDG